MDNDDRQTTVADDMYIEVATFSAKRCPLLCISPFLLRLLTCAFGDVMWHDSCRGFRHLVDFRLLGEIGGSGQHSVERA